MTEPLSTFQFAPEIEQSMVSLCFYAPERIATLKRELDPQVHFTRPELRYILEAIELAYRELGSRDFASVIQTLRELSRLEACGGPSGVNSVFEEYRYGFSSPEAQEEIFAHYIEILKAYAQARSNQPPVNVYRFLRGDITLVKNKTHVSDRSPDWIGEGKVAGRPYRASAFSHQDKNGQSVLAISLCPK
jgi:DnaB-like helicase N terminal domain